MVIRGGAIGDFVLTLPVLAALRAHFSGCFIEVLGYPPIASLAVAGGLADRVSGLESPALAGFFTQDGLRPRAVVEFFAGFELIVSYLYDPKSVFQLNIAQCGSAEFVVGPHRPDETLETHATELLLRPLEILGIRGTPIPVRGSFCPRVASGGKAIGLRYIPAVAANKKTGPSKSGANSSNFWVPKLSGGFCSLAAKPKVRGAIAWQTLCR